MALVTPIRNSIGRLEFGQAQKKLVNAAVNPRDKAFIATLGKTGMKISEVIQMEESNIDFEKGTITIVHMTERLKLKCPDCGELLGTRHIYCPSCGSKVSKAMRERVVQQRQRVIPVDRDTLRLLGDYLGWRRRFPYRGPLVFPFSRQRGWQLVEKIGRRAGIRGLNNHSLRQLLVRMWLTKGLDMRKLQILLGQGSMATTIECADADFEQLRLEYQQLWEGQEDEATETKDKKGTKGDKPPGKGTWP
jgi:integrase/recombinase XerD